MCGIAGIWGGGDERAVGAMVAAMGHRGPDDRGVYRDGDAVALGMARLSILDVSAAGHQPMANPDESVWIVYNGEVYNFAERRRELEARGYAFRSHCDTEVVLRMYEAYGDDFLLKLRGMFALAVYDRRGGRGRERLLLARDHLGIKPLLYAPAGGKLLFASEVKALLASGLLSTGVDPDGLRQLLAGGSVFQPNTILSGVHMLPPAHRMVLDRGGRRVERYWSLGTDRVAGLRDASYETQVDAVAAALEQSVRAQLVSDVPLGAFLSGGVDSSLVVALMARAAGGRVKTFSVGFDDAEGAGIDETDDAARTAAFLGTEHTRIAVTGEQVRRHIERVAWGLDQPSVDGVNSYFVCLAARHGSIPDGATIQAPGAAGGGVTVALSGTGGDELFAGYPWFIRMALFEERRRRQPWRMIARAAVASAARSRALDGLLPGPRGPRLASVRSHAGFLGHYAAAYQVFGPAGAARLMAPHLRRAGRAGRAAEADLAPLDELPRSPAVERVTGLCLRGYCNNQLLRDIDAVSMAHSLEVRVPFLDPALADVALSLPPGAKMNRAADVGALDRPEQSTYRASGAKRILIDAGRPLLPPDFDLQPKRGFGMPFETWLRGPVDEVFRDALSDASLRRRGLLDVPAAAAVRDDFLAGRRGWAEPWLLMMTELWCRQVLDRGAATGGGAVVGLVS